MLARTHARTHACACVHGTTHTDGEQNTPRMVFFISSDSMSLASCFAAASVPAAATSSLRSLSNLSVAWNIDVVTIPAEQCSAVRAQPPVGRYAANPGPSFTVARTPTPRAAATCLAKPGSGGPLMTLRQQR